MGKLDKSKDYAEVIGMPGVAFEQDGKHFNSAGDEVGLPDRTPPVDMFTDMDRATMLQFLEDNNVKSDDGASDDELRAECREVF